MTEYTERVGAIAHAIDKRLVIDEVPLALRTYTNATIGGDRTDYRRYADGPDALPQGEPRENTYLSGVRITDDATTDFLRAMELYRVRCHSELYDEWMVDMTLDLAYTQARAAGRVLADCHRCHITTAVSPEATYCAYCRTGF